MLAIFILLFVGTNQAAYQGFGTDVDYIFHRNIQIGTLEELKANLQNFTKITFKQDTKPFQLQSIILISNLTHLKIQGPAEFHMFGLYIQNCSNIILQNLRILNASIYGVLVYNSKNVILNSLTILDAGRVSVDQGKCIDVTEGSQNITISYSILGYTTPIQLLTKNKGLLIANFKLGPVTNLSLHHNLFYCDYQRSPQISTQGLFDMVNNVIFNYTEYGSRVRQGAYGNFNSNSYIGGKKDPLVFVDQNPSVYSIYNIWKQDCTNWAYIDDKITRQHFQVPIVNFDKFADARKIVTQSGCQNQSSWETMIRSNVLKHVD